ncbi:Isonitrile hydratase [Psilocybe cubensis]|uniref:DJ-1/PfpI domain-containing protein n=2 Tax=Psilocybe cubensis TaxID=181762 RepID=A0A8H7XM48_PSICU|nr:Isonitrile hydratase [Psilocybe cubensis]KAH9479894.1 Isonitrile hydratase [Psilocybe cubensis]
MSPKVFNMGLILIQPEFQWLDASGPVDYINNHSRAMISHLHLPGDITDKAPIINWHYISSDLTPVQPTSGPLQVPTCTFATCPPLDFIVVPGPDPTAQASKEFTEFIQQRVADPGLRGLLMVCTASLMVAQTGVLDGHQACTAKVALKAFSQAGILNKSVKWVGDRRWVVDGKLWSAAGITSGIDLAAEFARVYFDPVIVQLAKDAAEYEPKPAYPDPFARLLDGVEL